MNLLHWLTPPVTVNWMNPAAKIALYEELANELEADSPYKDKCRAVRKIRKKATTMRLKEGL